METELYKCEKCGTSFEITKGRRLATFVLHKPHEWKCPSCGRTCYELKKDKNVVVQEEKER